MRVPESGMPEEAYWERLFDVPVILARMNLRAVRGDVVELGCGYGSFTVPIARETSGQLHAFDIDPAMITRTTARAQQAGVANLRVELRDVLANGFGRPDRSCDVCLLFNILHCPEPESLLREAHRILRPNGRALVVHWRSDIPTPRGPPLAIRPRAEQLSRWARSAGLMTSPAIELPPWHFGMTLTRSE